MVCLVCQRSRQKRPNCPQQLIDVYRLRDICSASTVQSLGFVSRRCKRGYCDDRNGFGLTVLFEQAGHVESVDSRQSDIHEDQIRLFIVSEVDRFQPPLKFSIRCTRGHSKNRSTRHTETVVLHDKDSFTACTVLALWSFRPLVRPAHGHPRKVCAENSTKMLIPA